MRARFEAGYYAHFLQPHWRMMAVKTSLAKCLG